MDILGYKPPVKVHMFHGQWVIRDPQNREVFEFKLNTGSLDYHKRMQALGQLIADLLNGKKSVSYDPGTKSYEIMNHLSGEDYQPEPSPVGNGHVPEEIKQAVVEAVVTPKRRGRPPKK